MRLPLLEPEFPRFPHLMTQDRIDERKTMISEFTNNVLRAEKPEFGKQSDTYFTDKIKDELSLWGALCYDMIYMNKNSRFQRQVHDISYLKGLESRVKTLQDSLQKFNIRRELERAKSMVKQKMSLKDVSAAYDRELNDPSEFRNEIGRRTEEDSKLPDGSTRIPDVA